MLNLFSGTTLDVEYSVQNYKVPWTPLDIGTNRLKVPVGCILSSKCWIQIVRLDIMLDTNCPFGYYVQMV